MKLYYLFFLSLPPLPFPLYQVFAAWCVSYPSHTSGHACCAPSARRPMEPGRRTTPISRAAELCGGTRPEAAEGLTVEGALGGLGLRAMTLLLILLLLSVSRQRSQQLFFTLKTLRYHCHVILRRLQAYDPTS